MPWIALALWFASAVVSYIIHERTGKDTTICMVKRLTGVPCPGCGGTRSAVSMIRGEFATALKFNPLATLVLPLAPFAIALWVYRRRAVARGSAPWLTRRTQHLLLLALCIALALNWVYVLWREFSGRTPPSPRLSSPAQPGQSSSAAPHTSSPSTMNFAQSPTISLALTPVMASSGSAQKGCSMLVV